MKRQVLTAVAFVLAALPAQAGEQSSWYAAVQGGVNWGGATATSANLPGFLALNPPPKVAASSDAGWAIVGTVGTKLGENFRLEGEYSQRESTLGGQSTIDNTTLMLNALVALPLSDRFSVGVGGGVGVDWVSADVTVLSAPHSATSFAYQLIGEGSFALNEHLDLTLSYRHLETSDLGGKLITAVDYGLPGLVTAVSVDDVSSDTISVGLRFAL